MKHLWGKGALLLLVLILAAAASGCHRDGNPQEQQSGEESESIGEADAPIRWDSESAAQYVIVVATDASGAERDAAIQVQTAFRESLGVELLIRADLIKESAGYIESNYEIVVGRTNRSFSPAYNLDNARSGEYCLIKNGAKLLLAGGTDEGTEKAVALFISRFLSDVSGTVEFRNEDSLVCDEGSYALKSLQLNGEELRGFNISCDISSSMLKLQIGHLIDAVKTGYGYSADTEGLYPHTLLVSTVEQHSEYAELLGEYPAVLAARDGEPVLVARDQTALIAGIHALSLVILKGADQILINNEEISRVLESQTLSSMTFNLAGETDFYKRKDAVLDVISSYLPAVFGIQEGKTQWLSQLDQLEIYSSVGSGTAEEGHTETFNNLYYRTDLFSLVDGGTFWLSDTGEQGSKFPESKRVRIATYARLKDLETGREILCVNTHLDNQSATAREKQLDVIRQFISRYDLPCVLTGDFNSKPDSNLYIGISAEMDDSRVTAAEREPAPTFNGFGSGNTYILDYALFTHDAFDITLYKVHTDLYDGDVYPSDHNAVYVEYALK